MRTLIHRVVLSFSRAVCLAFLVFLGQSSSFASADSMPTVRFIHAAVGSGPVDIFVDGQSSSTNVKFATVSSYQPIAAGSHQVQVSPAGKGVGAATIKQMVSIAANTPYTIAILPTSSNPQLTMFTDNNFLSGAPATARVYHLSPDAGSITIASAGYTLTPGGLAFKHASVYAPLTPGPHQFQVTAAGQALPPISATVPNGKVGSAFLVGLLKGTSNDTKIRAVVANMTGIPGRGPNTGSDPTLVPSSSAPPLWPIGILGLFFFITSMYGIHRYAQRKD